MKRIKERIEGFLKEKGIEQPDIWLKRIKVEEPKREEFGDLSTNAAMVLSKELKKKPRDLAEDLKKVLESLFFVKEVKVEGPGFVNIFLSPEGVISLLKDAESLEDEFGSSSIGKGKKVLVEFVSANPTGPLHIGHGRGAALGDALSNLLEKVGYTVEREYYINDAGTQMKILGRSVYLRYLQLFLKEVEFPEGHYMGDYIVEIAEEIKGEHGDRFLNLDEEKAVDEISRIAEEKIMNMIKEDLENFGVNYDRFYSESDLYKKGLVERALKALEDAGYIYEEDGALWFRSTSFGDEKDRVIRRRNGEYTYFASDIAYHMEKFERGFDILVDIWGADHHGYIKRLKGAIKALGKDDEKLKILLTSMVNLLKGGKPVSMSTRRGEFYPLKDLLDEVGKDVARFVYLTRDHNSPLDFDIDKAKEMSSENPVFYVQYCHARICSMKRKAKERGVEDWKEVNPSKLNLPEEISMAKKILLFPHLLEELSENFEVHKLTYYLYDLSSRFHSYYNKHRVIGEDTELTKARLFLSEMVRRTVNIGLDILGVEAPEEM